MSVTTKKIGTGKYEILFDGTLIGTATKAAGRYQLSFYGGEEMTARNTGSILDKAADWVINRLNLS